MELKFNKNQEYNRTQLDSCKLNGTVDPKYAEIIKEVVRQFNDHTYWERKVKILDDFNANYMMPWELWQTLYNNFNNFHATNQVFVILAAAPNNYLRGEWHKHTAEKSHPKTTYSYGHIYGDSWWPIHDFKQMNTEESLVQDVSHLETNLKFPHWELHTIWKHYEKNLCSFPSNFMIKAYEKKKALHKSLELIDTDNDDKKWFRIVLEVEEYDPNFIEQITEHRLGQDLSRKELWELYIEFLKRRKNIQKLLQTYSKYCRFYLSDLEMKEEYRKATEIFGPSKVWWQNPFDFEIYESVDANFKPTTPEKQLLPSEPKKMKIKKEIIASFSKINTKYLPQNFSFKDTLIYYIFKNANSKTKKKLLFSCKEFYLRFPNPIAHKLILKQNNSCFSTEFCEDSIKISADENTIAEKVLPAFHLSTALYVFGNTQTNLLKNFLPKIIKCDAKYLEINDQNLTYKEMKFLIGQGNVLVLVLKKIIMTYDNGDFVAVEDIMAMTPSIEVIKLEFCQNFITSKTSQILSTLPFKNQIRKLDFSFISSNLEPYDFMTFLERTLGFASTISLVFRKNPTEPWDRPMEIDELFKVVREGILKKWGWHGPKFSCNTR